MGTACSCYTDKVSPYEEKPKDPLFMCNEEQAKLLPAFDSFAEKLDNRVLLGVLQLKPDLELTEKLASSLGIPSRTRLESLSSYLGIFRNIAERRRLFAFCFETLHLRVAGLSKRSRYSLYACRCRPTEQIVCSTRWADSGWHSNRHRLTLSVPLYFERQGH